MLRAIKFVRFYGHCYAASLMLLVTLSASAHAQTNYSTKYSTFNVGGTSVEQIWQSIQQNGPRSKLGIGHAGYTTFDLQSPVRFVTKNGKCHISSTSFSGEWMFLPWDNDLTWGSNWVGTSTSDVIYADVDKITFGPVPGHDLSVIQPSHPFINTENHREWNNHQIIHGRLQGGSDRRRGAGHA